MADDYKRINFRLSSDLSESFQKEAESRGVTRSKLLKIWLDKEEVRKTDNSLKKNSPKTYNLKLSKTEYDQLISLSEQERVSLSHYVRSLIKENLSSKEAQRVNYGGQSSRIQKLWLQGRLHEGISNLEKVTDTNNISALVQMVKFQIDAGNLASAENYIDQIQTIPGLSRTIWAFSYCAEAEVCYHNRYLHAGQVNLRKAKDFLDEKSPDWICSYYYQMQGLLMYRYASVDNDYADSVKSLKNALKYTDGRNFPIRKAKILIALGGLSVCRLDFHESRQYFGRALEIVSATNNFTLRGYYLSEFGFYLYLSGLGDPEPELARSFRLNQGENMNMQTLYTFEKQIWVDLQKGDIEAAREYTDKATRFEKRFLAPNGNSFVGLFDLALDYINSKGKLVNGLDYYLKQESNIKHGVAEYTIHGLKYKYGTEKERKISKGYLRQMSQGGTEIVRNAATNTLQTSILHPVR